MTTTIHKWYIPNGGSGGTIGQTAIDLTLEEELMVEADQAAAKAQNGQWEYADPIVKTEKSTSDSSKTVNVYYYAEGGKKVYVSQNDINKQNDKIRSGELTMDEKDTWEYKLVNGELKEAHIRYPVTLSFKESDGTTTTIDTFKYRLSPFTNMSKSMATYAYNFSYTGTPSTRRTDANGLYGDWRWYFNEETINNEYHLYAFLYTSNHVTVYMDGVEFLDFDWDPAFDYKDLDGDGKGDDISRNNNGLGFNLWHYFMVDMMLYTPTDKNIDSARKVQAGDCPFNLYVDYCRFYQDLDDPSMATYFSNDINLNK